jgi:recombination protein RecA
MKTATLRSNIETALAGRVLSPFVYRDRKIVETVSAGIPEIDLLTGGLPRGGFIEICGLPCSGCTTLLVSALARLTEQSEVCALVDGRDAFDPYSADVAGVNLKNLLWVRCRNVDQSLRATDLLLQSGGFGMVVLDLSDIPAEIVRYVPLNVWFRFRRAVEDTETVLLLLERESNAKTCASLVLRLSADSPRWKASWGTDDGEHGHTRGQRHPLANLLSGFRMRAEVVRSRIQGASAVLAYGNVLVQDKGVTQDKSEQDDSDKDGPDKDNNAHEAFFEAGTTWGYPSCGLHQPS